MMIIKGFRDKCIEQNLITPRPRRRKIMEWVNKMWITIRGQLIPREQA